MPPHAGGAEFTTRFRFDCAWDTTRTATRARTAEERMGEAAEPDRDRKMLARCLELSREAIAQGEDPFACVIGDGDRIVAEATTRARRDADVSRHAELLAMSDAQKTMGTRHLGQCTIYSIVEPCAM